MLRFVSLHEVRNFSNYTTFWVAGTTDYFNGSYENVAIKREQRLLADYAERKQRKDCEAGLIIGVMGER